MVGVVVAVVVVIVLDNFLEGDEAGEDEEARIRVGCRLVRLLSGRSTCGLR